VKSLLIPLALAAFAYAQRPDQGATKKEERVSDQESYVLESSRDPKQLVAAALTLARSQRGSDHQALERWLSSTEFLGRLDSVQEYAQTGRRLRIQRVLQALQENPAPGAKSVLVALTESRTFQAHPTRVDYLLRACASVRPAPPEVVRFWDRYSQPDDGFSNVAMKGAIANGSAPAMALLEKKLADAAQPEEDRTHWILCYIVEHRNDPGVLAGAQRMLAGELPAQFRPLLIDALFDYRPTEWYAPAEVCKPPDRGKAGPEARTLLRSIGSAAIASGSLTDRQRQAVEKTLKEIGER
jgi:hypothetical protein